MHKQDFKPLLDQIRTELKEVEAARQAALHAAVALREKAEGREPTAGEKKARQGQEADPEWRQLEASLQGLHDSTLALNRSIQEGNGRLHALASPEQGAKATGRERKGESYQQMSLIYDNQIKILSAMDGLKRHVSDTAGFQDRWLLVLAAGLILNLALCLGFLSQGLNNTAPAREHIAPAAIAKAVEEEPEERETEGTAPTFTKEQAPPAEPVPPVSLLPSETAETLIGHRAGYAMAYLKQKAFDRLSAKYFHPEKGIHFLPFGLKADGRRFSAEAIAAPMSDSTVFHWGAGEAGPIKMNFKQYYLHYIFDVDFTQGSEIQYNELHFSGAAGLSAGQVAQKFPDCAFAEYYKAGRSLILVFEKGRRDNNWYLSAAIHNQ